MLFFNYAPLNQITSVEIESPRLASSLPSTLSAGLQALPRLEELTISDPTVVESVPVLKAVRCLKLAGLAEYTGDWRWLADVKGLEEIEISIGEESIHVHGGEADVKEMSATGTLNVVLNLPEYMRSQVGITGTINFL